MHKQNKKVVHKASFVPHAHAVCLNCHWSYTIEHGCACHQPKFWETSKEGVDSQ